MHKTPKQVSLRSMIQAAAFVMLAALALVLASCASKSASPSPASASVDARSAKGGAQLWQETCSRCHNIRSPTEFSNTEWEMFVHHMRIRANLTGEEQQRILAFIQSANQSSQ